MTLVEQLPLLYGIEKNGKMKTWSACIHTDGVIAWAEIEFGQIDGKKQVTRREYTAGKNIGKKNETSCLVQCTNETKKKWLDKKDKEQYTESLSPSPSSVPSKIFPMLAQTYDPTSTKRKKNDIVFPCFVQPKLDGLRCIVYIRDNDIHFQSRTGMYFETLDHLAPQLQSFFKNHPGAILDGELYTTDYPFEELAGLIKKKKLSVEDKEKLKFISYHIYDVVETDKPFALRSEFILLNITSGENLVRVETVLCEDTDKFKEWFSKWVGDGYEGIMLRNTNSLYQTNYRSHDLQKYKEFKEDEFEIVGCKEGEGRDKGTVLWTCKTPEGRTFSVRPRGTVESRKELFVDSEKYIGKRLTVIYQELSEMNVPRFPVGKDIRDNY